jgi:hypothetical protein
VDEDPAHRQVLVVPLQGADTGHLFKCPYWKRQQRILWTEVRRETERGKYRFKARDLFADECCSQAILDFLSTTDVGRLVPGQVEEDAQSEASEWELRERSERERGGSRPRSWAPRVGNSGCSSPHPPLWPSRKRDKVWGRCSFVFPL